MNIISIDPSLNSTAIIIQNNEWHHYSFFNNYKKNNKWCKQIDPFVNFCKIDYEKNDNFSKNEVLKLKQYSEISKNIAEILKPYLNDSVVKIESYSQGSKYGRYQDLVTFGTLVRAEILKYTDNIEIIAPKELKKLTANKIYPKDKKGMARNNEGKAGGSFTKWDMFQAVLDLNEDNPITVYCKDNEEEIKKLKNVPKPLEDLIDAYFLNIV